MDKYLKKPERSKNHSANVSAADRARQYKKSDVFEDGGKLFCRSCMHGINQGSALLLDLSLSFDIIFLSGTLAVV